MKACPKLIIAALLCLCVQPAPAQQDAMVPGKIRAVKVDGNVWQVLQSSGQRERLNVGDFLRQGNLVETSADGSAILLFDNGSTMNLRPGTKFSINEFLRDPFDAQKVDYKDLKNEPTRSVTKVKVQDGAIFFDIPKLKNGSTCDIQNPLGTAGIRGTAGFVAQDSMGVTEGLVQVQTQTGQTQSLGAGQSTGFTPQGNFGPPPNNANQNMQEAQSNSQSLPQSIPADAFAGAPQTQAAAQGDLTPEQQESIEQAAKQGEEALVEAVKQIASENPDSAPAAAAAAAALMPDAAPQVAAAAAAAVPQNQQSSLSPQIAEAVAKVATEAAPQIAAAVAGVAQQSAPQVAAAVAGVATEAAPQVAAAVASVVTGSAAQVAAAVAQTVPSSAPQIAGAVANAVPSQAVPIAQNVAQVAPTQADAIATAVTTAAPSANTTAVTQAAQQGAQQGQTGGTQTGGSTGGSTETGSTDSGGGAGGSGSGSAPPLPSGGGGGGGGGGGVSPTPAPTPAPTPVPTPQPTPPPPPAAGPFWNGGVNNWVASGASGGGGTWTNASPWNPLNTATFGGTPGTVILQGDIQTFNGLTFNSGNSAGGTGTNFYKIQGYQGLTNGAQTGRLQLAGASNVITTASNVEAAISADLVGTNGFIKEGSGQLGVIRTSNNLSGTIDFRAGELTFGNSTLLTNASVVVRSNAPAAVAISNDLWFSGVGSIRNLTVESGAFHYVGSGDTTYASELNGTLNVLGDATYQAGSSLIWSLRDNTTLQRINPISGAYSYSSIDVTGNLNVAGSNLLLNFGPNSNIPGSVDWTNPFWNLSYTGSSGWLVFDVTGSITGTPTLSAPSTWVDSQGKTLSDIKGPGASFVLDTATPGKIYLNYIYSP